MGSWGITAIVVMGVVLVLLAVSIRVFKEYERGVAFRLGRLRAPLQPGVRLLVPVVDSLVRVDLRVVTLTIPPQEVISKDNVPARVNAVVLFQVTDPVRSVMAVENHAVATSQIAQTTLRSVVGRADLDTLLAHRADLNEDLARSIDSQTQPWGVRVNVVEIKDVEIPQAMQRAMAREAEAERERRAKVINAHGELQASEELAQAAETLSRAPASLQLRYLQTLLELGADQNSTVVFPLPIDIIGPFLEKAPEIVSMFAGRQTDSGTGAARATAAPASPPPASMPRARTTRARGAAMTEFEPTDANRTEGTPRNHLMVLGAVIAVLGPLFGLLAGSMAGSPDPDSTGQLFQYFVGGLFVGGFGAVIVYIGFVRYRRWRRKQQGPQSGPR